jgi:hypothetical protein
VPRHVARLLTRLVASLVVDYFAYAARPGASACRAARHAAHRTARRRLLRLRRASGCLGSSSTTSPTRCVSHWLCLSCGYSSTTPPRASSSSSIWPTPRIQVPQHVAQLVVWLIVDYFASRRLVRRASGCLGTSRGPSRGSSSTTPCATTSSCCRTGSTPATLCVATTYLAATLALLRVWHAPSRRCFPVTSRRPFI